MIFDVYSGAADCEACFAFVARYTGMTAPDSHHWRGRLCRAIALNPSGLALWAERMPRDVVR